VVRNLFYFLKSEDAGLAVATEPESKHLKRKSLLSAVNQDVLKWLSRYTDLEGNSETAVLKTSTLFNVDTLYNHSSNQSFFQNIVNLKRVNDIQRINAFLTGVNRKLPQGGHFIGCVETQVLRKKRILEKFPPLFGPIYYFFDFLFKRVFPKIVGLRAFYLFITNGRNQAISKAEILGRLYFCGYKIVDLKQNRNMLYFVAEKVKESTEIDEPQSGPLIRMKRQGKDGTIIHVHKLRTMYPYSECLQEYIYEKNHLRPGGKFRNDFRISTMGNFLRGIFVDELPMLWNMFKGDLKLVGVRPVSMHYLSLYSEELRAIRKKVKPGLIPPFYADLPLTLDEIMASEMRYIQAYLKNPVKTDVYYFFRSLYNILVKRARSK